MRRLNLITYRLSRIIQGSHKENSPPQHPPNPFPQALQNLTEGHKPSELLYRQIQLGIALEHTIDTKAPADKSPLEQAQTTTGLEDSNVLLPISGFEDCGSF